mgnify:CR=1 FL=1
MDTTDPEITFDKNGICNHCHDYDNLAKKQMFTGEAANKRLDQIIKTIKDKGREKKGSHLEK